MKIRDGKRLTQFGLMQVLWRLVQANGGSVTIPMSHLATIPPDSALKVIHDSRTDSFTLSITKVTESSIIIPRMN
jgi:hypothetical protein